MLIRAMGGGYEQHYDLHARAFEPGVGDGPAQLTAEEIEPYLVDRLRAVGWQGTPVLDLGLAPLLYEATGGERAAIDRTMTALLDDAAREGHTFIAGDSLVAWLDEADDGAPAAPPAAGLAEAQILAIEGAFAEHDRAIVRLREELTKLRDGAAEPVAQSVEARLAAMETRLDQQDAALRHVLERLIGFFEEGRG